VKNHARENGFYFFCAGKRITKIFLQVEKKIYLEKKVTIPAGIFI
jgi:hypothetical protein